MGGMRQDRELALAVRQLPEEVDEVFASSLEVRDAGGDLGVVERDVAPLGWVFGTPDLALVRLL